MKVLVAGIGNIFMGDDGFGCAVARRLQRCALPIGLEVCDFGIRDLDLYYALSSSEFDLVIVIDAIFRGVTPGSLQLMEPTGDGQGSCHCQATARTASAGALRRPNPEPTRRLRGHSVYSSGVLRSGETRG